jgi:hypothetical protein
MARQYKYHTLHRGITATTVFNGDEFNGIVNDIIELPLNSTPKNFKGYYAITLTDTVSSLSVATTLTDPCVEAYGLPWRWSTFMGCSSLSSMPLNTYTHKPSTWSNMGCLDAYPKRWVREPHIMPATPLTSISTSSFGACTKGFITWVISTNMWSVSTGIGATVTDFPYSLRYSTDGSKPYTVSIKDDTPIKIEACQPITCEVVPNSLTIYVDQTSMASIYNDLVVAVNTTIRPRLINYLATNGHPAGDVQIKPINGKRYFNDLANNNVPLSGHGNTNYSMVFIDIPTAYITCTNPSRTTTFETDFSTFINTLTSVHPDVYKLTIFNTTSGTATPNICPASKLFHDALYTGTDSNYPDPYNFAFRNQHINVVHDVLYKNTAAPNPSANSTYYTNLMLNALNNWGIDLVNYIPILKQQTLCDSVTATIPTAPRIRLYTANRFVLINTLVKFQNLTLNPHKIANVQIDFDNGSVVTYTGIMLPNYLDAVYTTPGYKTIKIRGTTNSGAIFTQQYTNIIKVVDFYD